MHDLLTAVWWDGFASGAILVAVVVLAVLIFGTLRSGGGPPADLTAWWGD